MYKLIDFHTRNTVQSSNLVFTGKDSPWEVEIDLEEVKSKIQIDYFRDSPPQVSKYLSLLPINDYRSFVSLKEGATPLLKSKVLGKQLGLDLYFKVDSKNPTGSFKDRGSAVELSVAKEMNAPAITVASTGNMAASCACYAATAGIPCFVFVPEGVPTSKLAQVISFGGRIVQVKGTYNDAARLAQEVAEKLGFYLAGDYAFRLEGAKTAAYEVADQLRFSNIDYVVVPMGCGTNLAAYAKGFSEYVKLGLLEKMPKLIGSQASGASPIIAAYNNKLDRVKSIANPRTVASAIAIGDPLDGDKAIKAIYESQGYAFAIEDQEIIEKQYLISREEGLYIESSAASAVASLYHLSKIEDLSGKTAVVVMCGDGLKDPSSILKAAIKPPTIDPNINDFLSFYENKFFEGRTVTFVDTESIIFDKLPELQSLKERLFEKFAVNYSDFHLELILNYIESFLKKGKAITVSDLQDIIQDALETLKKDSSKTFKVADFEVYTGKDRKPEAKVAVILNGKECKGEASGVGPVDALVNALRFACSEQMEFALSDYKVEIRSTGVDAVVYVELKLQRKSSSSVGCGTSPDIIQASIEAFEDAYNGLEQVVARR